MNIDKHSITLQNQTYPYFYSKNEQEILEIFKETLNEYINIINSLLNKDLKQLSDDEFYDLLQKVYSISLTEEDYLKILSKRNHKKYKKFIEIGTFMTFKDTHTEGYGASSIYFNQLYQIKYIIAITEDAKIESNSILSKNDIKQMVEDKSIVLISRKIAPIKNQLSIDETLENIPLTQLNNTSSCNIGSKIKMRGYIYKDDTFPIIVSMLRRKFTKKRILKDMKDYLEELQYEIDMVVLYAQQDCDYGNIAKICNAWYQESQEKEKVNTLKRRINNFL